MIWGKTLTGPAWGTSQYSNLKPRTLPEGTENVSASVNLSDLASDASSVTPTLPFTDSEAVATTESYQRHSSKPIAPAPTYGGPDVFYLAAPENLNPGLYIPPPVAPLPEPVAPEPVTPEVTTPEPGVSDAVTPEVMPPESNTPESANPEVATPEPETNESEQTPFVPFWEVDGLTVDLSDDFSSFGQGNRIIEPTVTGTLPNGDRLAVTTGLNRFVQPDVKSVFNVPLKAAWTGEMGDFTTTAGGGVDLFNRLPVALNLNASTSIPIGEKAVLSFFVDYGPYKFNATTLNNQIKAWRYGPNLFWQIDPDTYLFSLVRWGRYNDGNQEQQSFSRLERKVGDFSVSANVFTWQYRENAESASGYFSPPDFLVANGEIGWSREILDWLDCRAAASWGRQRLSGAWASAYGYNAQCTFQIAESLEMDLGYAFSNVLAQTGGSAFNNRAITGQVRAKF
ncbi:MAG: hypothetical protein F6K11_05510 [Leptolyngbya sp. SIO3F4]|nr:hypothetical protein [Leptolyngbya sp. SIO3F4]